MTSMGFLGMGGYVFYNTSRPSIAASIDLEDDVRLPREIEEEKKLKVQLTLKSFKVKPEHIGSNVELNSVEVRGKTNSTEFNDTEFIEIKENVILDNNNRIELLSSKQEILIDVIMDENSTFLVLDFFLKTPDNLFNIQDTINLETKPEFDIDFQSELSKNSVFVEDSLDYNIKITNNEEFEVEGILRINTDESELIEEEITLESKSTKEITKQLSNWEEIGKKDIDVIFRSFHKTTDKIDVTGYKLNANITSVSPFEEFDMSIIKSSNVEDKEIKEIEWIYDDGNSEINNELTVSYAYEDEQIYNPTANIKTKHGDTFAVTSQEISVQGVAFLPGVPNREDYLLIYELSNDGKENEVVNEAKDRPNGVFEGSSFEWVEGDTPSGDDTYLVVSDSGRINTQITETVDRFTIDFWVITESTSGSLAYFYNNEDSTSDGFRAFTDGVANDGFYFREAHGSDRDNDFQHENINIQDGNWHHLAITFDLDEGESRLYHNGEKINSGNYDGTSFNLDELLVMGHSGGDSLSLGFDNFRYTEASITEEDVETVVNQSEVEL